MKNKKLVSKMITYVSKKFDMTSKAGPELGTAQSQLVSTLFHHPSV